MHDRAAVADHQARADSHLEVVQRVAFVIFVLFAVTMTKMFRRVDMRQSQRERATRFVVYLFEILGIAASLLQLYNTALLGSFWPFFTGIIFQLITAVIQFARMILLPPQ